MVIAEFSLFVKKKINTWYIYLHTGMQPIKVKFYTLLGKALRIALIAALKLAIAIWLVRQILSRFSK